MGMTPFLIPAIVSALVTLIAVRLIPRARQSPVFDRVLWASTWLLAFLGATSAPNYIPANSPLNDYVVADVRWMPLLIGALVGALSINLLLWVMDRFSQPTIEDDSESTVLENEDSSGTSTDQSTEQ